MLFRLLPLWLVCVAFFARPATAQSFEAYVTGGAGGWQHDTGGRGALLVAAGGVEWLALRHVGIAGEGGVLASPRGGVAATLAVDARLHPVGAPGPGAWAPYLFVGYAPLRFLELSDQGLTFGGGVDYRIDRRRALRVEVRDILRDGGAVRSHYWTVRLGVTFR